MPDAQKNTPPLVWDGKTRVRKATPELLRLEEEVVGFMCHGPEPLTTGQLVELEDSQFGVLGAGLLKEPELIGEEE